MIGDVGMCTGKKQFATYYQAHRAARRLNRRQDGSKINAYKCPNTHHFHTGNSLGKYRKRTPSRHTLKGIAKHERI